MDSQNCLDTMGRKSNEKIGSSYCHGLGGNQVFAYTKRHQIMSDDNCLDASNPMGPVNMVRCHGMGGNQEWVYDEEVSGVQLIMLPLVTSNFHVSLSGQNNQTRKLWQLFNSSVTR